MTRGDRGSIAPLVPIVMFGLLALGGLVVDGSRQLNARGTARAFAEEAARAGATAIDYTSGEQQLDTQTAALRVNAYCAAIMHTTHANVRVITCQLKDPDSFTGAKTCDGTEQDIVVNTVVTVQIDTQMLGMIGITHFSSSATAAARSYQQTFDPDKPGC